MKFFLPAAGIAAFVLLVGFAAVPAIAYPVGAALFVAWLVLSAPERRAARAQRHHS